MTLPDCPHYRDNSSDEFSMTLTAWEVPDPNDQTIDEFTTKWFDFTPQCEIWAQSEQHAHAILQNLEHHGII